MPNHRRSASLWFFAPLAALVACGSSSDSSPAGDAPGTGSSSGGSVSDGGAGSSSGGSSGSSGSGSGSGSSSGGGSGGAPNPEAGAPGDASAPADFWGDTSNVPPAKNVMTFKFLNRTNGKFQDSEVFWSFKNASAGISETHSIAEMPTYDMPANASGRMYFYLCAAGAPTNCTGDPTKSQYYDFIEHTIGATQYNGNTTRVDAFGLKIAMRLHCADGYDVAVGEDYATFAEDRAVTFQKFVDEAPAEFKPLAQPPHAPYRIVEPGAEGFGQNGAYADYYTAFIDSLWANNGLTIPKPGANGSGLGAYPNLSAAIFRHVGDKAGTFSPDGKLLDNTLWSSASTFYTAPPANYYARFWHEHGLNGKAYGFPYDDVGGYSSYVSHKNPQYMLVAIGW